MIADKLKNSVQYETVYKPLKKAFTYLKKNITAHTKDGTYKIQGKDIYAIVQSYNTVQPETKRFEAHRKYIDIQYVVKGKEIIYVHPVSALNLTEKYNRAKDAAFYKHNIESSILKMHSGTFAVFFPQDGHKPGCIAEKSGRVKKVVVKVRVW
ncbi:MAG: hypothetical protein A2252_12410 [Elusimicrobia bacterium RIFOXYA2_FULL_39_19]|nr:MAG: hypothetical protein A2252_12410 [Elusimicrobia bacterium RIFOXYA2_FULL_39_19]